MTDTFSTKSFFFALISVVLFSGSCPVLLALMVLYCLSLILKRFYLCTYRFCLWIIKKCRISCHLLAFFHIAHLMNIYSEKSTSLWRAHGTPWFAEIYLYGLKVFLIPGPSRHQSFHRNRFTFYCGGSWGGSSTSILMGGWRQVAGTASTTSGRANTMFRGFFYFTFIVLLATIESSDRVLTSTKKSEEVVEQNRNPGEGGPK